MLGTGVGGNCSSGMDGSETITRRYPGRDIYIYMFYMPLCPRVHCGSLHGQITLPDLQ